jgi:hypothetical protein
MPERRSTGEGVAKSITSIRWNCTSAENMCGEIHAAAGGVLEAPEAPHLVT